MVTFVLTLGLGAGDGSYPGRLLTWGRLVPRAHPARPWWGRATRSQLRLLPGTIPTSFFCLLLGMGQGTCLHGRGCCRAVPHGSPSLAFPTVRLQLPDGAERGRPPAAQPHQVPTGPAVLRGAAGAGAGVCVHTTERDAAPGPSRQTCACPAIAARPALHHLLLHTPLHALGLHNPSAAAPTLPCCCGCLPT